MTRFQNFLSTLTAATSLLVTAGACGTSSNSAAGSDGGTSDGASGSEGLCDTFFDAQLAYSARCTERYDPARASDLRQRFDTQCAASLNAPSDTGFANYLQSCAAATQSAACGTGLSAAACEMDAVAGALNVGDQCAASTECQSSYCDFSKAVTPTNQDPGCGQCIARIADGQYLAARRAPARSSNASCKTSATTRRRQLLVNARPNTRRQFRWAAHAGRAFTRIASFRMSAM